METAKTWSERKKEVWDEIQSTGATLLAHGMGETRISPKEEKEILKRRKVLMKQLVQLRRGV